MVNGSVLVRPEGGPAATVVTADLAACDALVYVVDHVLLPDMVRWKMKLL